METQTLLEAAQQLGVLEIHVIGRPPKPPASESKGTVA